MHNPSNAKYVLFLTSQSRERFVCGCVTHQADELPVEPTHDIRSLLRLGSEDAQASHEHGGRFLVERRLDVLNLGLCICPAWVGTKKKKRGREDTEMHRLVWVRYE